MTSFVIDLGILTEKESPGLTQLVTDVQVQPGFITDLKETFENRLDTEEELTTEFELETVYEESWSDDGDEKIIKQNISSLSKRLHPVQKRNKGLLFHTTDSELLVAHYHANEGWVKDSEQLISGDRVDKDSVISMFALEEAPDSDDSVVNADFYTESTTFMEIFGVLSDEVLREIPEREVYISGNPDYDNRYSVKYSFDRDQCMDMVEDGSLSLDVDSDSFLIEKSIENEPHMLEYEFEGGRFGLTRSENVSNFERDVIQYRHGWLTSRRIYQNLVGKDTQYAEYNSMVQKEDATVQKFEQQTELGDVVFSKHDDEGIISQEFADDILRSIIGQKKHRLYFASHLTVPENKNLQIKSGDHTLNLSNIRTDSIEDGQTMLKVLYDQATNESLQRNRRYLTAAGLLVGITHLSDDSASDSLISIARESSFKGIEGFIRDQLDSANTPEDFRNSLNTLFDEVGTDTKTAELVEGEFDYDSFYRLVEMINQAGEGLKLSAGDLSELDEEGYRSVITIGVDQRIDGNLTREAETKRGPSDIRLRNDDGEVIYIGECKYWNEGNSGVQSNLETPLDQLSTYDQDEKFNSVIIFFESDEFKRLDIATVWGKISDKLNDLDKNYKLEDEMTTTNQSRIYEQTNGGREKHYLSIHVIDVSSKQHHQKSLETSS